MGPESQKERERHTIQAKVGLLINWQPQIKTIPPTLKNLTNLVKLSLIDNLLEELPDEIGDDYEFPFVSSREELVFTDG